MGKIKLILGASILLFGSIANSGDVNYSFQNIADTSQGLYSQIVNQRINDSGEVAFAGDFVGGGGAVIRSDGVTFTTIVNTITNPEYSGFSGAYINNLGQVATVPRDLNNMSSANLVGDGVNLSTLSNSGGNVTAINDRGDVLLLDGGRWIGIENGGVLNIIANTRQDDPVNGEFSAIGGSWINDLGEVVFYGTAPPGESYGNGGRDAIILWDGTELIPLFDNNTSAFNPPAEALNGRFNYPSLMINDNGAVIFSFAERTINPTEDGLFITDGVTTSLVARQNNTTYVTFITGSLNLNNSNEVAFGAILEDNTFGIYTGGDPTTDSVIESGDELFNSIVTDVRIRTGGLNNKGQIVFQYILVNGTSGIAIATPETEPTLVTIDIKPGSDPNCFNINSHGVIPVAILGSDSFDVTQIAQDSLSFGGLEVRVRGNKGTLCQVDYSDGDEYLDLVCQFEDNSDYWSPGEGEATLTGSLINGGGDFEGTDSICVVP